MCSCGAYELRLRALVWVLDGKVLVLRAAFLVLRLRAFVIRTSCLVPQSSALSQGRRQAVPGFLVCLFFAFLFRSIAGCTFPGPGDSVRRRCLFAEPRRRLNEGEEEGGEGWKGVEQSNTRGRGQLTGMQERQRGETRDRAAQGKRNGGNKQDTGDTKDTEIQQNTQTHKHTNTRSRSPKGGLITRGGREACRFCIPEEGRRKESEETREEQANGAWKLECGRGVTI